MGYVECMREKRNACSIFMGKIEGKRPLGIPRHRWEDNLKTDLEEIMGGYELDSSGSG
jgi:hypothetical protein